jgi:hypothetical protein
MIFQTPHIISRFLLDGTQVSYLLRCSNQDIPFIVTGLCCLGFVCLFSNLLWVLLQSIEVCH